MRRVSIARWELLADAVAERRQEDRAANRILGADTLHWRVPDCIYRYHPHSGTPLYSSDADIFGSVDPAERGLIDELAEQMAHLPTHDQILVPLTIGHHVDHQLTRAAAERAFGVKDVTYYEDYPYAEQAGALENVISADQARWHAQIIPLTGAAVQAKMAAIAAFKSQLSTFFNSHAHLEQRIQTFTQTVGGERVWRQATQVDK